MLFSMIGGLLYIYVSVFSEEELYAIARENRIQGGIILALIMFLTTVVAPLTSLPLVPLVAPFLGPLVTSVSCFVGWTFGSIFAFYIGRIFGQPVAVRIFGKDAFEKYKAYIQPHMSFTNIVILRMVLPVDLLSYALGIWSTVSFPLYISATMVGIVWFSIIFAYLGEALYSRHYVLLVILSVASVLILIFGGRYLRSMSKTEKKET